MNFEHMHEQMNSEPKNEEMLVYEVKVPRVLNVWEFADRVVRSINIALESWLWASFEREAVAAVCNELLENVIKYSDWSNSKRPSFELRLYDERRISIRTSNAINLQDKHHERFQAIVSKMGNGASDANLYEARIHEIATSRDYKASEATQLGLLRLTHENRCALSSEIDPNGFLTVIADMDLNWMWSK